MQHFFNPTFQFLLALSRVIRSKLKRLFLFGVDRSLLFISIRIFFFSFFFNYFFFECPNLDSVAIFNSFVWKRNICVFFFFLFYFSRFLSFLFKKLILKFPSGKRILDLEILCLPVDKIIGFPESI